MSGTLSKSGSGTTGSREYSKHGDYIGSSNRDSIENDPATKYQSGTKIYDTASGAQNTDVYRKDYARQADTKSENSDITLNSSGNSIQDYNQKLVNQYAEMDKLGDVILYELGIVERRYASLLDQYKMADKAGREVIARQLDKLTADQLTLYKSYTKVYKDGKTDWPAVKSEVERSLLNLRGVEKR